MSILAFSQVVLAVASDSIAVVVAGLWLFFVGFNTLEAMLPSEVSQAAPDDRRGAALGVYNTFQFAGVFFGGVVAGGLHGALGVGAVFAFCAVLIGLWGVLAVRRVFGRVADPASRAGDARNRPNLGYSGVHYCGRRYIRIQGACSFPGARRTVEYACAPSGLRHAPVCAHLDALATRSHE